MFGVGLFSLFLFLFLFPLLPSSLFPFLAIFFSPLLDSIEEEWEEQEREHQRERPVPGEKSIGQLRSHRRRKSLG